MYICKILIISSIRFQFKKIITEETMKWPIIYIFLSTCLWEKIADKGDRVMILLWLILRPYKFHIETVFTVIFN